MLRRVIRSTTTWTLPSPLFFSPLFFTYIPPPVGPRISSGNEDTFIGIPERRTVGTCSTPRQPGKCNYADALNYRSASAIVAERVCTHDRVARLFFRFTSRFRSSRLCHSSLSGDLSSFTGGKKATRRLDFTFVAIEYFKRHLYIGIYIGSTEDEILKFLDFLGLTGSTFSL